MSVSSFHRSPVHRKRFTSGYADRVHSPQVVSRVLRTMMEQYPAFAESCGAPEMDFGSVDTLVGTGLSGALIVPALARSLRRAGYDVDYLLVRKDNDGSHSSYKVEGSLGSRWLFVDDLISSGRTLCRCISRVADVSRAVGSLRKPQLAGVFLYGTARDGAGLGFASLYAASQYWCEGSGDLDEIAGWRYRSAGRGHRLDEFEAFELARPRVRSITERVAA